MSKAIDSVTDSCYICASLRKFPKALLKQSIEDPPECVGSSFAADITKRNKQLSLVLHERTTVTCFIGSEQRDTLREGLICLCTH